MSDVVDIKTRRSTLSPEPIDADAAVVPAPDRPQGLIDLLGMVETWRNGTMPVPAVWALVGISADGGMSVYGSSDRPLLELVGLLTAGVSSLTTIATSGR